ncbi:MAG: AmmeMemoRadiSam system protein A [Gammaproteobacteria bacterium]
MSSNNGPPAGHAAYRDLLLQLARQAIQHGLTHSEPMAVEPQDYPAPLREPRACFVTLQLDGQLRGCIGSLEAFQPLVADLAANAHAAAFHDPRFPPLTSPEFDRLSIHISILSPPEPLAFADEQDLLEQIRPGVDGLVLSADGHRGTFLPSVWESLSDPRQFVNQLKRKAGLPPDYWSDRIEVWRYTAETIE